MRNHIIGFSRWLSLAALLVLFAAVLLGRVQAQVQPDGRLVELVSRVSFSEALDSYPDAALVWQATEGHSDTTTGRVAWLERHSPCVSGRVSDERARARPGNCAWARELRPSRVMPRPWPYGRHAWQRLSRRWLAHIDRVRALVRGHDTWRPCAETPQSWDGVRWRERVEARGHRVLECEVPYVTEPGAEGLRNLAVRWD